MSNPITKEIRIHIRHRKAWVEYETKTGRVTKIECDTLANAETMAHMLHSNVENWTEE